jgi:hypothetical protein
MRGVKAVLAVGAAAIALALVVLLLQSPLTVAGTNGVPAQVSVELEHGQVGGCQPSATIPAGTSAIRIAIEVRAVGPAVTVKVGSGSGLLTEGHLDAGWGSAPTVTVPVKGLAHAVSGARICTTIGPAAEPFRLYGIRARPPLVVTGRLRNVMLRMEYLRPGQSSWLSLTSSIAYHMGLGRAASGTWIVFLALALMLGIAALATRLTLRELR